VEKFSKLVKKAAVRKLVPSKMRDEKMKINNAAAKFSLIGKGLKERGLITGLKMAGKKEGRRWSAWDTIKHHIKNLHDDSSPPIIFIKQPDGVLTLLDGDHRLVAAYLIDHPIKAIFIPEEKLKE
jgi:hypothetical protein